MILRGTLVISLGCVSSFCLGIGLFGSVYLMPVFLAFVRQHDAFEIGKIMLVTGVAQLIAAPLVTALDGKVDARLLTSFGWIDPQQGIVRVPVSHAMRLALRDGFPVAKEAGK